ncbi:hypothetical protein Zmor_009108 [Zophobas morio]|uniref:ARID domain-containing protein n=1 Tax=Zophobas morio TaxID=2755281 RepID=A0AA38MID8_9CUCU|nr:hypothetical protein Zmor_009108 [Zophobas morio]
MARVPDSASPRERDAFLRDLQLFHETRGTPFRRPPVLGGREVDLHLLYTLVTGQGGWIKVRAPCARRAGGADAAPPTAPCRLHQGGKVRVGSSTTRADRSRSPPPGSRHYAN